MKTMDFRACAAAAVLLFAAAAQAADKYYIGTGGDLKASTAANWLDGTVPVDGDTVVLDANAANSNLTWDIDVTLAGWRQSDYTGTVTFRTGLPYGSVALNGVDGEADHGVAAKVLKVTGDVTLESGTWTHLEHDYRSFSVTHERCLDGLGVYRLQVEVGGNMTIGEAAVLTAVSKGFYSARGPGRSSSQSGASHGGVGSGGAATYGSMYRPLTQGSAGNGGQVYGGGVIRLKIGGVLDHEGVVTASGPTGTMSYAPSGGSVYITAGGITGDGTIVANGADGTGGYPPAGGGRIALYLTGENATFENYTGAVSAYPGKMGGAFVNNCSCGTIYRETAADGEGRGELLVLNGGVMTSRVRFAGITGEDGECDFSRIIITNGARLAVLSGATVNVHKVETHSPSKSAVVLNGGVLRVPQRFALTNFNINVLSASSSILFCEGEETNVFTVQGGATLCMNHPMDLAGSLAIEKGGVLCHESNAENGWSSESDMVSIDLKVDGDMTVDSGGVVNAKGRGYAANKGPGAPITSPGAGSHGGLGTANASTTYGSIRHPVTHGSGGTSGWGRGGGAIKLEVLGDLVVNGRIDADASNYSGGGHSTGAGGSVWIIADSLSGTGQVRACGGVSSNPVGGGGRVAVTLTGEDETFDGFTGYIIARGGISANSSSDGLTSVPSGGAGTVYLRKGGEGELDGTLLIENGKCTGLYSAYISDSVTETEVGNVIVTNKAVLCVGNDAALKVHGDFVNHGSMVTGKVATAEVSAGKVEFTDAQKESRVFGKNCFASLKIATPGKTMRFGTGEDDLVTVLPNGSFFVAGTAQSPVGLKSENDEDTWKLRVCDGANADVSNADVSLSDASQGILVTAFDSGGEDAGNVNWKFFAAIQPGERIAWVGANSSAWGDPLNWSLGRVPVETDVVVIEAGAANHSKLLQNTTINDLRVEAGARLDLDTWSLTVTNGVFVAGTLGVSGGETLTAYGDVSLADVDGDGLTLVLTGERAQSAALSANAFKAIVIEKPSGSVAFSGGFSTGLFKCAPDALSELAVTFASGVVYNVRDSIVEGTAGDAPAITLSGAPHGTRWDLAVSRIGTFRGVNVADCNATASIPLYADSPSVDLGNNVNWSFDSVTAKWTGSGSGYFTNAANWSIGKVPDDTTRVWIDGAAAILTDSDTPVRVREIRVTGEGALSLAGERKIEIEEWFAVYDGGSVTMDVEVMTRRAYIGEGTITHTGPHALNVTNRVTLTVAGDMEICAEGKIDVSAKGWRGNVGLGLGAESEDTTRPSHGGRGVIAGACYGSVFHPAAPGTGSIRGNGPAGGGVVRLVVGGTLVNDGAIRSCCVNTSERGSSGGSIWITAGDLVGNGEIAAQGSYYTNGSYPWSGPGGRVAVYLTSSGSFDGFTGTINAYGGRLYDGISFTYKPIASCGTVYLQHALEADKCGTIVLDNAGGSTNSHGVELPVTVDGDKPDDYADVKLVLKRGAALALTSNLKVGDLVVEEEDATFNLNDFRLKVGSALHRDGIGWRGVTGKEEAAAYLDSIVNPGENSLGRILWPSRGFSIIVR